MVKIAASVAACGDERLASVRANIYFLCILSMQITTFGNAALAESPPIAVENPQVTSDSDDKAHVGNSRNATKSYCAITTAEINTASDGSVWLFCDINEYTHGHGYGGGAQLADLKEFVAIRVTPIGEVTRWSKQGTTLTTQGMGATRFFSKGGEVYGFLWTGDIVKFAKSGKAAGMIVDINPSDIGFPDLRGRIRGPGSRDEWTDHLDDVDRLNRNESFVELFDLEWGLETPALEIFKRHKLGLGIRFENDISAPDDILGWQRATAGSLDQGKPWRRVLIDVR